MTPVTGLELSRRLKEVADNAKIPYESPWIMDIAAQITSASIRQMRVLVSQKKLRKGMSPSTIPLPDHEVAPIARNIDGLAETFRDTTFIIERLRMERLLDAEEERT